MKLTTLIMTLMSFSLAASAAQVEVVDGTKWESKSYSSDCPESLSVKIKEDSEVEITAKDFSWDKKSLEVDSKESDEDIINLKNKKESDADVKEVVYDE